MANIAPRKYIHAAPPTAGDAIFRALQLKFQDNARLDGGEEAAKPRNDNRKR